MKAQSSVGIGGAADALREYAGAVARILLGALLVWMGVSQLTSAQEWAQFIPFVDHSSVAALACVAAASQALAISGLLLAAGIGSRLWSAAAAALFLLMLLGIALTHGPGQIGIRDLALAGLCLAVFSAPSETLTIQL